MSKVYGVFEVYGDGDGYAVFDLIIEADANKVAKRAAKQKR